MAHEGTEKQISGQEFCERLGMMVAEGKAYCDSQPINIDAIISSHEETQHWYDWYVAYYKADLWLAFDKQGYVVGDTVGWTLSAVNQTDRPIQDASLSQTLQTSGYPKLFDERTVNLAANGSSLKLNGTFQTTATMAGSYAAQATLAFGAHNVFTSNVAVANIEAQKPAFDISIMAGFPVNLKYYQVGEPITFIVDITNTGNIDLSNATLSYQVLDGSTVLASGSGNQASIAKEKTWTFYTTGYRTTEANLGKNLAIKVTVTANGVSKTVTYTNPFRVDRRGMTVTITFANKGTGINGAYTTGDSLDYTITITNTGSLTLDDVEATTTFGSLS